MAHGKKYNLAAALVVGLAMFDQRRGLVVLLTVSHFRFSF